MQHTCWYDLYFCSYTCSDDCNAFYDSTQTKEGIVSMNLINFTLSILWNILFLWFIIEILNHKSPLLFSFLGSNYYAQREWTSKSMESDIQWRDSKAIHTSHNSLAVKWKNVRLMLDLCIDISVVKLYFNVFNFCQVWEIARSQ